MSLAECRYEFDLIAILVVKFYTVGWVATLVVRCCFCRFFIMYVTRLCGACNHSTHKHRE